MNKDLLINQNLLCDDDCFKIVDYRMGLGSCTYLDSFVLSNIGTRMHVDFYIYYSLTAD